MKRHLLLVGLLTLAACSQAPVPVSPVTDLAAQRLGTAADDSVNDIVTDTKLGAVYALGVTNGSLDGPNRGGSDVFVRRYDRSGKVVWKRQLGNTDYDFGGLTIDRSGFVYVGYTGRLEKLRSDGSVVWTRPVPWNDGCNFISGLSTDANGNVFVGGEAANSCEVDRTVYLSRYTSAGSLQWTRSDQGGGLGYYTSGVATDAQGNVYHTAVDGDDDYLTTHLFKYNPSGRLLFTKAVDNPAENMVKDAALGSPVVQGDALYLAGVQVENQRFNPDRPLREDALVVKLSLSGAEQWRRRFGTSANDGALELALDAGGGIYVTGYTNGNLGGVYNGGTDVFFRKLDARGNPVWTKQIGSAGDDSGNAVAAYSSSELYLAGSAGGALLGGSYSGGQDGFLRRTDGNGNRVWTDQ